MLLAEALSVAWPQLYVKCTGGGNGSKSLTEAVDGVAELSARICRWRWWLSHNMWKNLLEEEEEEEDVKRKLPLVYLSYLKGYIYECISALWSLVHDEELATFLCQNLQVEAAPAGCGQRL